MNWIAEKLFNLLGPKWIDSLATGVAKVLAGALASHGASQGAVKEVVLAGLMFLFAQLQSFLRNKTLLETLPPAKQ